MGDSQASKDNKPPTSRRPLAGLFRRRSSSTSVTSSQHSRRGSVASQTEATPDEGYQSLRNRLTSPSMPSLFRPRTRSRTEETEPPLERPVRAFTGEERPRSIDSTASTASARPSLFSQGSSARTSHTSNQSCAIPPPPSPSTRRLSSTEPSRTSSASTARASPARRTSNNTTPIRPAPTPVAGTNRTRSRLSFSSLTGSPFSAPPPRPTDPATAAKMRTMPRLLSYTVSPPGSSRDIHAEARARTPAAVMQDLPPPFAGSDLYPFATSSSPPAPSTSPTRSQTIADVLAVPTAPASNSEGERQDEEQDEEQEDSDEGEDDDTFVSPDGSPAIETREEPTVLTSRSPVTPRMHMVLPQRSTPDRYVASPVTTPRRPTPPSTAMPGTWTTFSHTPGLTPFTARPTATSASGSYFDLRPLSTEEVAPEDATTPSSDGRPALASRRSRSLINLLETVHEPVAAREEVTVQERPRMEARSPTRRRSMYELREPPPSYNPLNAAPVPEWTRQRASTVIPRENEGRERLPGYTCDVHIEGYVPRKMEFIAPGIQAANRQWRRQYVVLHGTAIKIFKADPAVYPIPGEPNAAASSSRRDSISSSVSSLSSADASCDEEPDLEDEDESSVRPTPLHVHEGRYGEAEGEPSAEPLVITSLLHSSRLLPGNAGHNACVRNYSLQGAESGLAADYLKRKHVVRVRAEGEQFLIQAKDDKGVISWIECVNSLLDDPGTSYGHIYSFRRLQMSLWTLIRDLHVVDPAISVYRSADASHSYPSSSRCQGVEGEEGGRKMEKRRSKVKRRERRRQLRAQPRAQG